MEYYKQILKQDYDSRQRKNSSFSIRAYSQFLGLASATLSEVLRDRRRLPQKYATQVADKLNLEPEARDAFVKSVLNQKKSLRELGQLKINERSKQVINEQRDYNIIAHWEYYAFLNLIETKDFCDENDWIAQRLGIPVNRVEFVRTELLSSGYIAYESDELVRKQVNLSTTQDVFSKALRKSHKECLEMASEKIESVPVEERFYSSSTVPVSMDKLNEAKELVREFRDKLCALLKEGDTDEVYNLNIQLYPLTNK